MTKRSGLSKPLRTVLPAGGAAGSEVWADILARGITGTGLGWG